MSNSIPLRRRASIRLTVIAAVVVAFLAPSRGGSTPEGSVPGEAPSSAAAAGALAPPAAVTVVGTDPTTAATVPSLSPSPSPAPADPVGPTATASTELAAESPAPLTPTPAPTPVDPIAESPQAIEAAIESVIAEALATETDPALDVVAVVRTDDGGLEVQHVPTGTVDVEAAAEAIVAEGDLVAIELDAMVQLDLPEPVAAADQIDAAAATDPRRAEQWALDRVPFETAWSTSGGAGVIVAVIDTAADLNHADLAGQFVSPWRFLATGSGPGLASVPPGNFHGTHVSGIIAAAANNSVGIAGGAPGVKIMPIEVLTAAGTGRYSDITAAIIHAADQGAKVINLSLGGGSQSTALDAAVSYAVQRGAIVMASAGNDGCEVGVSGCTAVYPAASPGATAIGSVNSDLSCSSFTTRASYVALGAPGGSILSTAPTNLYGSGYVNASGTSMAAPYASAAAALLVAAHPTLAPSAILAALASEAVDVASGGADTCTGPGMIDPVAALDALDGPDAPPNNPNPPTPTTLEAPRLAGALGARGMVRLSFVPPAGAGVILVKRDGVLIASIPATRRSYTDRSVSARTTYTYQLSAYSDSLGESGLSVERSVTTRG